MECYDAAYDLFLRNKAKGDLRDARRHLLAAMDGCHLHMLPRLEHELEQLDDQIERQKTLWFKFRLFVRARTGVTI